MRKFLLGIMFAAALGMGLFHVEQAMAAAQGAAGDGTKAEAIDYPSRPVRLIVPFPPGGGADFMGRIISLALTKKRGYVITVDNRGGANGVIGTDIVAKATPDGYTLVLANNTTHVMAIVLSSKVPYDPLRDFTPISMITYAPQLLVSAKNAPFRTIAELIAYAKSKPGSLNYASGGHGSQTHLAMEMFLDNAGIKISHIPYKGTAPGFTALMTGEAQCMFVSMPAAMPHVKSENIRALGVTGSKRFAQQPNMPTIAESGVRGFEINPWFGVLGPAKLPAAIVRKLNEDSVAAIRDDEIRQRLVSQGAEALGSSPEEFAAVIKQELNQWRPIVDKLGLRDAATAP
jgi:tripartite-type tricarboxylate transporter receptor subunit TctC